MPYINTSKNKKCMPEIYIIKIMHCYEFIHKINTNTRLMQHLAGSVPHCIEYQ